MPSVVVDRSEEGITPLVGLASEPSSEVDGGCTCFLQAAAKGFHQKHPIVTLVHHMSLFVPGVSLRRMVFSVRYVVMNVHCLMCGRASCTR